MKLIRDVVPIEKWIDDPYYVGPEAQKIYPILKKNIIDFYSGAYNSFILYGSYGVGKTYAALMLLNRMIYEMSCFEAFPTFFGLSPSTVLKFYFISLTMSKSKTTGLGRLIRFIDNAPYYQQECPRDYTVNSFIRFPFLEVYSASRVDHLTGEDAFGAIFDESNFIKAKKGDEYEKAKEMYLEVKIRSKSRFSVAGRHYGLIGLLSSASYVSSFAEREVEEARRNPSKTLLVETTLYDVNPEKYSSKKFDVFVGYSDVPAHIIGENPESNSPAYLTQEIRQMVAKNYGLAYSDFLIAHSSLVKHVPEDFREFFEKDILYALRTIAGCSTVRSSLLLTNPKLLDYAATHGIQNPLLVQVPTLTLLSDDTIDDFLNFDIFMQNYEEGQSVYVHVDQSVRGNSGDGDNTGIAFCYKRSDGIFVIPLMLWITKRETGKEIDISKVLDIVFRLWAYGVNIAYVSYDMAAGRYARQEVARRLGEKRQGYLSVDKDDAAYVFFNLLLKKGKIHLYNYEPFRREYANLIHDRAAGKVDHPETNMDGSLGTKDCSDAVVGATYSCFSFEGFSLEEEVFGREDGGMGDLLSDSSADFFKDEKIDPYLQSVLKGTGSEEEDFYSDLLNESSETELLEKSKPEQSTDKWFTKKEIRRAQESSETGSSYSEEMDSWKKFL